MKLLFIALATISLAPGAFAKDLSESIKCYDKYNHDNHDPVFTAKVESETEISALTMWDDGKPGKPGTKTIEGKLNPLSRNYKKDLYFGSTDIILDPKFATKASFEGAIVVSNDERDGGTTHLHCLGR